MTTKKLLLTFILGLFLLSFVAAQAETLGTFKQNTCFNLLQLCSNCSYNNITSVSYPNGVVALSQNTMTKAGTSYSLNFCNSSIIGTYNVNGFGDLDGSNTVWSYTFDVTPDGNVQNPNFFYIILLLSLGVIILGITVFKNGWITVLGSFGLVYVGLYVIIFGINGIKDPVYTWGIGIIILALAGYVGIKSGHEMIEDL